MDIMNILIYTILFLIVFLLNISFIKYFINKDKDYINYTELYRDEDIEIFEKYNEDYKNETKSNSRKIILEFDESVVKDANIAVINYISNVNGDIKSINNKQVSKETINPILFSGLGSSNIGIGFTGGIDIINKNQYIIKVPKKAKFSDNLQSRIDNYLKYKNR